MTDNVLKLKPPVLCRDCAYCDPEALECHAPQAVQSCNSVTGQMPSCYTMRELVSAASGIMPRCGSRADWFRKREIDLHDQAL